MRISDWSSDVCSSDLARARGKLKKAVFDLHQSAERMYHCVLLVCSFYTPHVHNLAFLRTQAERLDTRLIVAWPRETKADRSRFEKLKEAYIKARYSKHYRISEDELTWLGARVAALAATVDYVKSVVEGKNGEVRVDKGG